MSHFRSTTHARLAKIALRIGLTMALAFGLVLLFANSEKAKTVYEITLDDTTYTVESYSDEMEDVLDEAGLELSASDCVDTAENTKKDTVEVSITHKQYVTVTCDGAAVSVLTDEGETVSDVLDQLNIELGKNTYTVKKTMTCSATAYTARPGSGTATGRRAQVGVIAVDPRVIPYGTRMYIQTSSGSVLYGIAVAGDCGGAVKGNIIDLYFNSYSECCSFGRRNCTVYILG